MSREYKEVWLSRSYLRLQINRNLILDKTTILVKLGKWADKFNFRTCWVLPLQHLQSKSSNPSLYCFNSGVMLTMCWSSTANWEVGISMPTWNKQVLSDSYLFVSTSSCHLTMHEMVWCYDLHPEISSMQCWMLRSWTVLCCASTRWGWVGNPNKQDNRKD